MLPFAPTERKNQCYFWVQSRSYFCDPRPIGIPKPFTNRNKNHTAKPPRPKASKSSHGDSSRLNAIECELRDLNAKIKTYEKVEKDTIGGDSHLKSSLNMSQGYADHSFDYSNGPWMNSHHTPTQMADLGRDVPTSHMDFTFCSPVVQHLVFGSPITQLAASNVQKISIINSHGSHIFFINCSPISIFLF